MGALFDLVEANETRDRNLTFPVFIPRESQKLTRLTHCTSHVRFAPSLS